MKNYLSDTDDNYGKGTMYAAVYPMMLNLVTLLNARALFGEDLGMLSLRFIDYI